MSIIDSHTHTPRPDSVINIDPSELGVRNPEMLDDRWYSVGIHPWNAGLYTQRDVARLRRLCAHPRVVAIGECGLDSVHVSYKRVEQANGHTEIEQALPDVNRQLELLKIHIALSEELRKPLLLHVVKRFPEVMRLRLKMNPRPQMPWIIHGFRGRPGLAKDLLRHGFYLSYGEFFNEAAACATPPDRMLAESDESTLGIEEIVAALPHRPEMSLPQLMLALHNR